MYLSYVVVNGHWPMTEILKNILFYVVVMDDDNDVLDFTNPTIPIYLCYLPGGLKLSKSVRWHTPSIHLNRRLSSHSPEMVRHAGVFHTVGMPLSLLIFRSK